MNAALLWTQVDEARTAFLVPFVDPSSRTWLGSLAAFVVIAGLYSLWRRPGWTWNRLRTAALHPSSLLDVQLLVARRLLAVIRGAGGLGAAWLLATTLVRQLDSFLGQPGSVTWPAWLVMGAYTAALFVAWDLSRYVLHRWMHRIPALWALHQVHHSAEVLTPLTFHRLHPLESVLYELRGALVTGIVTGLFFWVFRGDALQATLLGVPAVGLVLNVLFGNLRHSHVWLRFPEAVERWFLSPAQHQLHHSAEAQHFDANFGTWLAIWDRMGGSWQAADTPPAAYGIDPAHRNHAFDLWSALVHPVIDALGRLAKGPSAAASLVLLAALPQPADASEPASEPPADTQPDAADADDKAEGSRSPFGTEMVVYGNNGTPRVAGSAHVVDEEELETFEYDDIERVLLQTPGVTTRGEDGFGLRPNIGVRGVNSDRSAKLTLMEDGVLFGPAPYAAPAAYYFPMATRLTGVEVFKGPAATRFGPSTVGGAINVLTRQIPNGTDYALDVAGGLRGSLRAHAWGGSGNAARGVLVEGVHLQSNGFKQLDGGGPTGFDRNEFMAKARQRIGQTHELDLKLGFARERSNETYLGLTLADARATPYRRYAASSAGLMTWNRTQAELGWTVDAGPLQVRTIAYHHWLSRAWTKLNRFAGGPDLHTLLQADPTSGQGAVFMGILRGEEDTATAEQTLQIGTNDRTFQSSGVQTVARWEAGGDRFGSSLESGLRLHHDAVTRLHTENPHAMAGGELVPTGGDTLTLLDSVSTATAIAAHLHEDLRIQTFHVLPGVRTESVRTTQEAVGATPTGPLWRTAVLPSLGVLYEASSWADLFAGAYQGFSPVAPGQDPDVQPEKAWNTEGGFRIDTGDRRLELVGFYVRYSNLSGTCTISGGCLGDAIDQQFNGGEAEVYGVEALASADVLLPNQLQIPLTLTYTWTETAFLTGFVSGFPQFGTVEPGYALPYVPTQQLGARAGLAMPRWSLTSGLAWRSAMLDQAGLFPAEESDIPALLLVDASLRWQATPRMEVYAVGTNLTGSTAITSWRPAGARTTPPLQVLGGIKFTPPTR